MANIKIRQKAQIRGVKHWEIAAELGLTPSSFSVMLRSELSEDEQNHIVEVIDEIARKKWAS